MLWKKSFIACCAVAAIAYAISSANANDADFSSPEKTFATFQTAAKASDYEAMADCFSPAGHKSMAAALYGVSSVQSILEGVANPESEHRKKFAAFCAKHGVEFLDADFFKQGKAPEEFQKLFQQKIEPVQDPRAFVVELLTLQDEILVAQQQPKIKWDGELSDVEIDGDRATGKLNNPPFTITMEKTADGWKFVELFGMP